MGAELHNHALSKAAQCGTEAGGESEANCEHAVCSCIGPTPDAHCPPLSPPLVEVEKEGQILESAIAAGAASSGHREKSDKADGLRIYRHPLAQAKVRASMDPSMLAVRLSAMT